MRNSSGFRMVIPMESTNRVGGGGAPLEPPLLGKGTKLNLKDTESEKLTLFKYK